MAEGCHERAAIRQITFDDIFYNRAYQLFNVINTAHRVIVSYDGYVFSWNIK